MKEFGQVIESKKNIDDKNERVGSPIHAYPVVTLNVRAYDS